VRTQAQAAARRWFAQLARQDRGAGDHGPYSIGQALDDYVADYKRRGGKALDRLEWTITAHIKPALGEILVERVNRRRLEAWHAALAESPRGLRTTPGKRQKHHEPDNTPEGIRRRRSTANRVLTILKAALNLAAHNHRAETPERWQAVKPFRETDAPKIRYLTDAESQRLVNACAGEFRKLVIAALLTGCRYGELLWRACRHEGQRLQRRRQGRACPLLQKRPPSVAPRVRGSIFGINAGLRSAPGNKIFPGNYSRRSKK